MENTSLDTEVKKAVLVYIKESMDPAAKQYFANLYDLSESYTKLELNNNIIEIDDLNKNFSYESTNLTESEYIKFDDANIEKIIDIDKGIFLYKK
ncbi:MAG: hypothetical protein ACMXX9_02930 [Candidatus Woesearchaeota archaeon]